LRDLGKSNTVWKIRLEDKRFSFSIDTITRRTYLSRQIA